MKNETTFDLADIGFYTLSNDRADHCSESSPFWRCELLLTDHCNFACPYCRGMRDSLRGSLLWDEAVNAVDLWIEEGLRNVRFSGGEPTLWPRLADLCRYCRDKGVRRIAVSTNGSATLELYAELVAAGANDFSVSLDACCAADGDRMTGSKPGTWAHIVDAIHFLAERAYTTVGVVVTPMNLDSAADVIRFADSLGVADIRIIPAAQYNRTLQRIAGLADSLLRKYPILRYRLGNARKNRPVRGLERTDCTRCRLVLDDMAVAGGKHFPCIIYLREGGDPIGDVGPKMRRERAEWSADHNTHADPICSRMCLDVCVAYNNRAYSRPS